MCKIAIMSRRGKKRVDYSHFGVLDEDDDDFAEFTPPASKKIKTSSSKSEGKSKDKSSSKTEKNKNGRTERKSLNRPQPADEIFENELQMALEMSISESQEVKGESPLVDSNKENESQEEMESLQNGKEGGDFSNIVSVGANVKEDIKPCQPVVVANRSDDEIEVIATDITENVKPRRTPAPKRSKKQEESDFEDDMDDISSEDGDDDDDDYSGEDSDFDDGKKKSKSKAKVKQPKKSAAASKVKAAPVSKVKVASGRATKPSAAKSTVKTPTLKTSSAARPSVARPSPVNRPPLTSPSPRWNPPGPAGNKKGDTSSLCSPTSGLRLGLSRNMKLKPLHPNLQVQH